MLRISDFLSLDSVEEIEKEPEIDPAENESKGTLKLTLMFNLVNLLGKDAEKPGRTIFLAQALDD